MPCPPAGGCTCAASPTRNTRPARKCCAKPLREPKCEAKETSVTFSSGRPVRRAQACAAPRVTGPGLRPRTWRRAGTQLVCTSGPSHSAPPLAWSHMCQCVRSSPATTTSAVIIGCGSMVSLANSTPERRAPRRARRRSRQDSARARFLSPIGVLQRRGDAIGVLRERREPGAELDAPPSSSKRARRMSSARGCSSIHMLG